MKADFLLKVLLAGTLLFGGGVSLHAQFLPSFGEHENGEVSRSKRSGDEAFRAKDYAVAASFYTSSLREMRQKGDRKAVQQAYECLLDAQILGQMPDLAEKTLLEYEEEFPESNPEVLTFWRGEILLQQKNYAEAEILFVKLLSKVPVQDPRRLRLLRSYALALEGLEQYQKASKIYDMILKLSGKSPDADQIFRREVLCLANGGSTKEAMDLLLQKPLKKDSGNLQERQLLTAYVLLKRDGAESVAGMWKNISSGLKEGADPFVYLITSSFGDAFVSAKIFDLALDSYRKAFQAAGNKAELSETLNRMVSVISGIGDKKRASELALKQLDLFRHSLLSAKSRLQTAQMLADSGNPKEALQLYRSVFTGSTAKNAEKKRALQNYVRLQCRLKNITDAEQSVRKFYKESGEEIQGEYLLAEAFLACGRLREAVALYRSCAVRWKESANDSLLYALSALLDSSDYKEALKIIQEIRKNGPGPKLSADLCYYEAAAKSGITPESQEVLDLFGKFLRAEEHSERLVPKALYQGALTAFALKKPELSVEMLSRLVHQYSGDKLVPQAAYWLIHLHYTLNNDIAAERETWLLREKHPESEYAAMAMLRLAEHYADSGADARASAALMHLSTDSRFPKIQARVTYELALQAFRRKDYEESLRYLSELFERFPDSEMIADAYYLNGDILRLNSDFSHAGELYLKASEAQKNPTLKCAALGSLGDCLFMLAATARSNPESEFKNALDVYERMMKIPECPPEFTAMGLYRSGKCCEQQNLVEKAGEFYRELLYRVPANAVSGRPTERIWCVRAAEALVDLASKYPRRDTFLQARFALHWLVNAKILPYSDAKTRFDNLKKGLFNP